MDDKQLNLDDENLFSSLNDSNFLKKFQLPIYIILGGLIIVAVGILLYSYKPQDEVKVEVIPAQATASTIKVDLQGAVEKPGLYELQGDARMNDLMIKAGGLSAEADRAWVTQNLNLAMKLTDGQKIWIPKMGETQILNGVSDIAGVSGQPVRGNITGKVNINSASTSDLDALPGIGAVRASAIIKGRPYTSVEELKLKKILPSNVFDQVKDQVSVY